MKLHERIAASALLMSALALPAQATWSIVVLDLRTGEVAVGSATCIQNLALEEEVPVILVGVGAGATQSFLDPNATWRKRIVLDYQAGLTASETMADLLATYPGNAPGGQVGLVTFAGNGDRATFTGAMTFPWSGGVVGESGDLRYAIQGNVLTGEPVVAATEAALLDTPGDLSQKVMAAMQAAKLFGGDGRCSCAPSDADGCGSPPPDFEKSAHVGFVYLARIGDVDGPCDGPSGCVQGEYYLELADQGSASDPDPVDTLQILYDAWRAGLAGRPDGILSTATLDRLSIPADGVTSALATIALVDVDGVPLTTGGASLSVVPAPGSASDARAGVVIDHGDGSYSVPITAGSRAGTASFVVSAADGVVEATFFPHLDLRVDPLAGLHCGFDIVAATEGARVPLVVNESSAPGAFYVIVASVSGTSPGTWLGDIVVPLNFDEVTRRTFLNGGNKFLQGTRGFLDAAGRAEAALDAPSGLLGHGIGLRLDWAALTFDGRSLRATNAAGFEVVH